MNLDAYLLAWSKAFLLTAAVELPFVAYFFAPLEPRVGTRLASGFFAQLASHPAVWFVFPKLGLSYQMTIVWSEIWAVVCEGALYHLVSSIPPIRAFTVALAANLVSFGVGLSVRFLTGAV